MLSTTGGGVDAGARVVVDHATCITSGMCTSIAPEIFQIADDKLKILIDRPTDELLEKAENAVMCCPVEALSILTE